MNQPDRYSRFVLAEGIHKVSYQQDTKLENAGTFTMHQEDHTMGNLLRMQLHSDKSIVFAGYRIPHPLENKLVLKVQTTSAKTPTMAVEHALEDLRAEVNSIKSQFQTEAARFMPEYGQQAQYGQQQYPSHYNYGN